MNRRTLLAGLGGIGVTALLPPISSGASITTNWTLRGGLLESIPAGVSVQTVNGVVRKLPQRPLINQQMIELLKSFGVSGIEDHGIKYVSPLAGHPLAACLEPPDCNGSIDVNYSFYDGNFPSYGDAYGIT